MGFQKRRGKGHFFCAYVVKKGPFSLRETNVRESFSSSSGYSRVAARQKIKKISTSTNTTATAAGNEVLFDVVVTILLPCPFPENDGWLPLILIVWGLRGLCRREETFLVLGV